MLILLFDVDWFLFVSNFPDPWYTTRFLSQTYSDLGQVTSMCSSAQLKIVGNNVSIEILLTTVFLNLLTLIPTAHAKHSAVAL
jgi:hypothetical protein